MEKLYADRTQDSGFWGLHSEMAASEPLEFHQSLSQKAVEVLDVHQVKVTLNRWVKELRDMEITLNQSFKWLLRLEQLQG